MIQLIINNKKEFMQSLLTQRDFNSFLLEEGEIETFSTFHIDGRIHKEFFANEEPPADLYTRWAAVRPICFDMIKGKNTPLSFFFVFLPDKAQMNNLLEDLADSDRSAVSSLVLTVRFTNGIITATSGVSFSSFTLDKSCEKRWDEAVRHLFSNLHIDYTEP